ncbi:hypothetical protein I6E11_03230 [Bacteroides caecigallinarum]|uniref:hypothetical protein n=1 Tax=Bacteroides caecigallinarum TaxID=1411144 RepID=UPI001F40585B|nr:hypothetical protein [Bacteroides caecigallinarum]MCF2592831.1 hypothetical protein [Bacteroides caecigallinarum]
MRNLCKVIAFGIIISLFPILFSSCEYVGIGIELGNGTNNYRESTYYLCSRTWVEEWTDNKGDFHRQEIRFYDNNVGEDYVLTVDRHGFRKESSYTFVWDWYDANYTSLRLKYGTNDYSYMNNIFMGNNRLECLLDGYSACFYGY